MTCVLYSNSSDRKFCVKQIKRKSSFADIFPSGIAPKCRFILINVNQVFLVSIMVTVKITDTHTHTILEEVLGGFNMTA